MAVSAKASAAAAPLGCGLAEVPEPGAARVAGVGASSSTVDFQTQSNLLKVLIAVAASLPAVAKGSSTELCEVLEEQSVEVLPPALEYYDGYLYVMLIGMGLGFGIAALIVFLICWTCPCARPRWRQGVATPREGEAKDDVLLHHVPRVKPCEPCVQAKPRKKSGQRSVQTQSQVKHTWWRISPRFLPLGEREHGAWVD